MSAPYYVQPSPEIPGWMTPRELEWLWQRAKTHKTIVEVGCWFGRSTHALLGGNVEVDGGVVHAVDHFRGTPSELEHAHHCIVEGVDVYAKFMENAGSAPNLRVWRMPSELAARGFAVGSVDMVFLDADHTLNAVLSDLRAWAPKVRAGGLLCGHDRDGFDVAAALAQFFGFLPPKVVDSIWEVWV